MHASKRFCRTPLLALLVAGALGSSLAAAPRPDLTGARAVQAQAALTRAQAALGLDGATAFQPRSLLTNGQGRTIARFDQMYAGRRVWGAQAVVHLEPEGGAKALPRGIQASVTLEGAPRLTAEEAVARALRNLGARGALAAAPKVEPVVFPTRFTGGIAAKYDRSRNREVLDREMSVTAKAPKAPFVWAYEVKTLLSNRLDGHREVAFIVDGTTGAILRKWDEVKGDAPATGSGQSYYRGTVPLATTQAGDGTYTLRSSAHGTLPNPYVAAQGESWVGLTTCFGMVDMNSGSLGFLPYAGHATNTWGDGTIYPAAWDYLNGGALFDLSPDGSMATLRGTLSTSGETAAVDAHYGLSATWDFYRKVFGRDGIDDAGTSTFAIVHDITYSFAGAAPLVDNAQWSPWYFGMEFGDGTYPDMPGGMKAITELDITGHELTHGVTEYSAGLIYAGESGAMNEGNSDFFGKMVQAYGNGGATGTTVPDFAPGDLAAWEVGHHSMPDHPLRTMYKPSLDGISADGWYDGIQLLDVHFSSGVLNRALYFLAMGASADPGSVTYSPYLPSGMAGLGNDRAARIWYKALTEYLVPDADFEAGRAAGIQAAQDLYGVGSEEDLAVQKAFAAVNVGSAPGEPPRVRVTFPVVHPVGSYIDTHTWGGLGKVQFFPTRATVQVSCGVENATNPGLEWSLGTSWEGWEAGRINADGTWTTPNFNFYGDFVPITARSLEAPEQFAKTRLILLEMDTDGDTETDALDLGASVMAWGLPEAPHGRMALEGYGVDDFDLVLFTEAFTNAWGK